MCYRLLQKRLQTAVYLGFGSKPTGWRLRYVWKNRGSNKAFSTDVFGGKCSHEGKGYVDTTSLDVQDRPGGERCDTLWNAPLPLWGLSHDTRSLSSYVGSFTVVGPEWCDFRRSLFPHTARSHWHRSSLLSVISLPSSFWCPQVLQFPLLSLSNSAHVRTLINQCQVTECTTRAVFFNCPLSPHTSHCSKKLIQMARKQPMQHIKEMRQKWKESRRGKKRGGIFFPWNTRINTRQW